MEKVQKTGFYFLICIHANLNFHPGFAFCIQDLKFVQSKNPRVLEISADNPLLIIFTGFKRLACKRKQVSS